MPSTFKWAAGWTSRGAFLNGSELSALAIGAVSSVSAAFDNTTNLDMRGSAQIDLASLTPTAGAYLQLFLVQSLDGTNYEDPPTTSTNPGYHMGLPPVPVSTGAGAKRVIVPEFRIPPGKWKFALLNGTGAALATGSGVNTVALYTANEGAV